MRINVLNTFNQCVSAVNKLQKTVDLINERFSDSEGYGADIQFPRELEVLDVKLEMIHIRLKKIAQLGLDDPDGKLFEICKQLGLYDGQEENVKPENENQKSAISKITDDEILYAEFKHDVPSTPCKGWLMCVRWLEEYSKKSEYEREQFYLQALSHEQS